MIVKYNKDGIPNIWTVQKTELTDECIKMIADEVVKRLNDKDKIVRCEDCKYWAYDNFNDEGEITDAWCGRDGAVFMSMSPDDFCSRGEHK